MTGALTAALFLATLAGLTASSHYYVYCRLVQGPQWPTPGGEVLGWALTLLGLSVPLTLVALRLVAGSGMRLWAAAVFCWMGAFFILLNATAAVDLLRLLSGGVTALLPSLRPAAWPLGLSAQKGWALLALALALGGIGWALRSALAGPRTEAVTVHLRRYPAGLPPMRVVQISDLHVAMLLRRPYVERMVQQVMQLRPDLIVLTGDLIDGHPADLAADVAPLARLQAPYGVFGITGNHEYYSGASRWMQVFAELGIKPLRNARVEIGKPGASIDLAGVDDPAGRAVAGDGGTDFDRALAGRDPARELLLLAHQPKLAELAASYGVGLMLSGHTHGGQIFPFGALVRLAQPYLSGLHRLGDMQIYVNRGTGYWGPPLRLLAPAEITLLTLCR